MVLPILKSSDLNELDTRQRIMEVAIHLFALKGFDGASIREIAKLAEVNISSLNYHFQTKENLRNELMAYVVENFRKKINDIPEMKNAAEYAVKVHEALIVNGASCLNQFKLILDSENHPCETEPYPIGYEKFSSYLKKELNTKVPPAERLWLSNVVFSYVMHVSVMSSTKVGKKMTERFFPGNKLSFANYITELVESLIRDLNVRFG